MASQQPIQFTELADWMRENRCSRRKFGELASLDKMTVSRLVSGKMKRLHPHLVSRVAKATEGAVGEKEFAAFFARVSERRAA